MITKFEEIRERGRERKEKGERIWEMRKERKGNRKGVREGKPKSRIIVIDEKSCISLYISLKKKNLNSGYEM